MNKQLKYGQLLEQHNILATCPGDNVNEVDIEAFRWCNLPVETSINFLPNFVEDDVKKKPVRALKGDIPVKKCGLCAISFYNSLIAAKNTFASFNPAVQKKMGYTHIAVGQLQKSDGLITPIINNHFMLYEYVGTILENRFKLLAQL